MTEKLFPYFIVVIILSIIGESWYSFRKNKGLYDKQDTWTSIGLGLLGVVTRLFTKGLSLSIWFLLYDLSPLKIKTTLGAIVILFLLK
jgi:steroid 5-alpha reductase family enzyme